MGRVYFLTAPATHKNFSAQRYTSLLISSSSYLEFYMNGSSIFAIPWLLLLFHHLVGWSAVNLEQSH